MPRLHILVLILILAVPAAATPPVPPPASTSAPAAQPGLRAPDWSTPQDALLTFLRARNTQDMSLLAKSIAWKDPADAQLMLGAHTNAIGFDDTLTLCADLEKQYPDDDAVKTFRKLSTRMQAILIKMQEDARRDFIDTAEIKIADDTASVTMKGQTKPLQLCKTAGKWLLLPDSAGLTAPRDESERQQRARDVLLAVATRKLFDAYRTDLAAGKFPTGQQALDAFYQLSDSARKSLENETHPTTQR